MTANERTTIADRCARCDASTGAPDANALLAEARAQLEEARRERDAMRAAADAAGVRIAELRAELADALRSLEATRCERDIGAAALAQESAAHYEDVASLRSERDRILSACQSVHRRWSDARLSAEQALLAEKALAAEKAALVARVGVLEAELSAVRGEAKCYANAVGLIDCAMGIYGLPVSETVRAVEAAALKLKRVGVVLSRGSWFVDRHMESAAAHVLDEIREAMRDDTAARRALEVET